MKIAVIVFAVLVGIVVLAVAIVALIGSMIEPRHTATRSTLISRPRSEVYRVVSDPAGYPAWRTDVASVDILPAVNGRVRFREHSDNGAITYEISEQVPDEKLVTTIVDEDLGYRGTWTYAFTSDGDQTLVTITEDGEVTNVIFRFMARFIFGYTSGLEAYLKALQGQA